MPMLEHALAYAARGWRIFPCHPKTKQPLVPLDKDPETGKGIPGTGWATKATADEAQIRAWWKKAPKAMIGLPCGANIKAFVLDVDAGVDKDTGEVYEAAALQMGLEQAIGCQLPPTLFVRTPRGGVHIYFALPDEGQVQNRAALLGKGSRIDVRGDGGYVIAPPSVRADGVAYAWSAEDSAPAAAPPALLDLVLRRGKWADAGRGAAASGSISERAAAKVKRPPVSAGAGVAQLDEAVRKYALSALDSELSQVRGAAAGSRNDTLNIAALKMGQLVAAGALHEGFVRAALEDAAEACHLISDDGIASVRATIESGFRKGKSEPRQLDDIRRAVADREQRRPRAGAAARISSSAPSSSSSSSLSSPSPAPPQEANGKPSSQTGASEAKSSAPGAGGERKLRKPEESDEARNLRLAFFPLTDLGNAERFYERYRDRLKFCEALGWLCWDDKRWSRDGALARVKIAEHETVRAIQEEAEAVRESGRRDVADAERGARDYVFDVKSDNTIVLYSDKIAQWGRASESMNKLGALSKRGEPYFMVSIDKLDADKMKINVNNGTLTVRRRPPAGEEAIVFGPHDPADLITKLAPVDYDQTAVCPEYDKFFGRIQPREDMRSFLHQWGGLSFTGDVSEQKLAFLYGKGGNGKSVLIDAWSHVAGDYGETIPIETFLEQGKARSAGQATPDLAMLPGKRMLRTSEPEKNSKLAEAMIKLVTGGEPIQARHLNRDFFKFYPEFKLTISGNYRPTIAGTDEGIWRRVRLVPFSVSIPKEERDITLGDKLRKESSGILNRLLQGLREWLGNGLMEPDEVVKATAEYRSDSDPLGRFLATCVEASETDRVQSSVLYAVFEAWCKSSGEKAWSNRGFSLAMKERGYHAVQSNFMWWTGVKLIKAVNDFVDHHGNPLNDAGDAGDAEPSNQREERIDAGSIEV